MAKVLLCAIPLQLNWRCENNQLVVISESDKSCEFRPLHYGTRFVLPNSHFKPHNAITVEQRCNSILCRLCNFIDLYPPRLPVRVLPCLPLVGAQPPSHCVSIRQTANSCSVSLDPGTSPIW